MTYSLRAATVVFFISFTALGAPSTGTWTTVATQAPSPNSGTALLLSDGSVICLSDDNGGDTIGRLWHKLTPDSNGSYINGTWSSIAPMIDTRLYCSSQVLKDGRVYVAGGEYGTGLTTGEVYNPLTNLWTATPIPGGSISDANSEMLPDGKVLQALVTGNLKVIKIYDPVTNTYAPGPSSLGIHNEATWSKLPDDSILMVDRNSTASERYIPALNQWIADSNTPVPLYDPWGLETGGAVLLPDGRSFWIGSLGTSAYYTPSGTVAPGVWAAGPTIPNSQGTPDAPIAIMPNGKILAVTSPVPTSSQHFPHPSSFWEFDYTTNVYTQLPAPTGGGMTVDEPAYVWTLLVLPNGGILCTRLDSRDYWIFTPDGSPVESGRPHLSAIVRAGANAYSLSGTLFNGISQGACYGDDWQMNTNYPIVRLTSNVNGKVYYARTFNWNRTSVMTGAALTTTQMTVPASVPKGQYSLEVVANGIASPPTAFANTDFNCQCDFNADAKVDGADLGVLLGGWGQTGAGDVNADGFVDGADLGTLLGEWGPC